MSYSCFIAFVFATPTANFVSYTSNTNSTTGQSNFEPDLRTFIEPSVQRILELTRDFKTQPTSPAATLAYERQLQAELRELGRVICQFTYNRLEPDAANLPPHVSFQGDLYTRIGKKTQQSAWTLFGQISLWRMGYRPTCKNGEPTIFPLALALGLTAGASPALAERASFIMASAGSNQNETLRRLREEYHVGWGVKKLRQVIAAVSAAMAEERHEVEVEKILELLRTADASKGRHRPVLSVGRDGVTLGLRIRTGSIYEVATTGTVTVFDRQGKRLGTVYLAYTPEPNQPTMSAALTALITEVLRRWDKPLPRLSYVTDSGDNETSYYEQVLRRMKHPRTGEKLEWIRVADYYHASERIWTMAELLFGKGKRAAAWARKMQKWLLKPGGVNRVLHSAAALRQRYKLSGKKLEKFQVAYRYLRDRMRYMDYAQYRRWGVPLGSGVTEAACKTVYGQRLKQSGMRWLKPGAQAILNLRVLVLSGVWDAAYERTLSRIPEVKVGGQLGRQLRKRKSAA